MIQWNPASTICSYADYLQNLLSVFLVEPSEQNCKICCPNNSFNQLTILHPDRTIFNKIYSILAAYRSLPPQDPSFYLVFCITRRKMASRLIRANSTDTKDSETSAGSSINTQTLGWLLYADKTPQADDEDSFGELYNPIGSVVSPKALRTNHRMSKLLAASAKKKKITPGKKSVRMPERCKGATNHRLNSPYLQQPKSQQLLDEEAVVKQLEDEALGLCKPQKKTAVKKKEKKGYMMDLLEKVKDKVLLDKEELEEKVAAARSARSAREDKEEVASSLEHEMHREAKTSARKRMLALVHMYDAKIWSIPKVEGKKVDFGGSTDFLNTTYSEFYSKKLANLKSKGKGKVKGKSKAEGGKEAYELLRPHSHQSHNSNHSHSGHDGHDDFEDNVNINKDPLYRIMREEEEGKRLSKQRDLFAMANNTNGNGESLVESVSSEDDESLFNDKENLNRMTEEDLKEMLKIRAPSPEVWINMRIIFFLFAAYHHTVIKNDIYHDGAEHQSLNGSVSTQESGNGSADMANEYTLFWIRFQKSMNHHHVDIYNVHENFTWPLMHNLLCFSSDIIDNMNDIERGNIKKVGISYKNSKGLTTPVWQTGQFYSEIQAHAGLQHALRSVINSKLFQCTPRLLKLSPAAFKFCLWGRRIAYNIAMSHSTAVRTIARLPKIFNTFNGVTSNQVLPKLERENSVLERGMSLFEDVSLDGESLGSSVVVNALSNIKNNRNYKELRFSGNDIHPHQGQHSSPNKEIASFINASTLQTSASLNQGLKSQVESCLHVTSLVPPELAEQDLFMSQVCSPVEYSLALVRPCDRLDVVLGQKAISAPNRHLVDPVDANRNRDKKISTQQRYYEQYIMLRSRSPMHRVSINSLKEHEVGEDDEAVDAFGRKLAPPRVAQRVSVSFAQMKAAANVHTHEHTVGEREEGAEELFADTGGGGGGDLGGTGGYYPGEDSDGLEQMQTDAEQLTWFLRKQVQEMDNSGNSIRILVKRMDHVLTEKEKPKKGMAGTVIGKVQCIINESSLVVLTPPTWTIVDRAFMGAVSRFVVICSDHCHANTAFQQVLRLAKPCDLIFLVTMLRREDETAEGQQKAQALAASYHEHDFNVHVVLESQMTPAHPSMNIAEQGDLTYVAKLLSLCQQHDPTHILFDASPSDILYAMDPFSGEPELVDGEKRLARELVAYKRENEVRSESAIVRQPCLVLSHNNNGKAKMF